MTKFSTSPSECSRRSSTRSSSARFLPTRPTWGAGALVELIFLLLTAICASPVLAFDLKDALSPNGWENKWFLDANLVDRGRKRTCNEICEEQPDSALICDNEEFRREYHGALNGDTGELGGKGIKDLSFCDDDGSTCLCTCA